jgi:hypothetical protein
MLAPPVIVIIMPVQRKGGGRMNIDLAEVADT